MSYGKNEKKMGWKAQPTAAVVCDGVRVPAANRLGAEGQGFKIAMDARKTCPHPSPPPCVPAARLSSAVPLLPCTVAPAGGDGDATLPTLSMRAVDGGRINIASCSIGGAQFCLDTARSYAATRKQFGRSIAAFQNTQFSIADMATALQVSEEERCRYSPSLLASFVRAI